MQWIGWEADRPGKPFILPAGCEDIVVEIEVET